MGTENRGFASMSQEKRRKIASKGGKAAHEEGMKTNGSRMKKRAHEWTEEEAREAGRKGWDEDHHHKQAVAQAVAAGLQ